jgi:hypothetical protein
LSSQVSIRITAADEASATIRQVATNAEGSFNTIKSASRQVEEQQKATNLSFTGAVTAFSGVATSAFALYNAYDRVADMTVAVDRANLQVKTTLNSVEDAQRRYNTVLEKYPPDSKEAIAAAADLKIAQERYGVAVERAEMMQGNLNEAIVQSVLSVIPIAITMVTNLHKIYDMLKDSLGIATTKQYAYNESLVASSAAGTGAATTSSSLASTLGLLGLAFTAVGGSVYLANQKMDDYKSKGVEVDGVQRVLYDSSMMFGGAIGVYLGEQLKNIIAPLDQSSEALQNLAQHMIDMNAPIDNVINAMAAMGYSKESIDIVIAAMQDFAGETKASCEMSQEEIDRLTQKIQADYEEQVKSVEQSYQDQLAASNAFYDDLIITAQTAYMEKADALVSALDDEFTYLSSGLFDQRTEMEKFFDDTEAAIEKHYDEEVRTVEEAYDQQVADTNAFYDDMLAEIDAGLADIRDRRSQDLDNLELNYLLQKQALEEALANQQITEEEFHTQMKELETTYREERGDISDTYRIEELQAEATAKEDNEEIEQERADALKGINEKKAENLKAIENQKNTDLNTLNATYRTGAIADETTFKGDIAQLNQDRADAVKGIEETHKAAMESLEWAKKLALCSIVEKMNTDMEESINTSHKDVETSTDTFKGIMQGIFSSIKSVLGGDWSGFCSGIVSAFSGAVSSVIGSLQSLWTSLSSVFGNAWTVIQNFISGICFAHAIEKAVKSSTKDLDVWVDTVESSMNKGTAAIKGFGGSPSVISMPVMTQGVGYATSRSTNITVYANVASDVDIDALARKLADRMNQEERRLGLS